MPCYSVEARDQLLSFARRFSEPEYPAVPDHCRNTLIGLTKRGNTQQSG